jgi:hypothetical protein
VNVTIIWAVARVISLKSANVSEALTASITREISHESFISLNMKGAKKFITSVNLYRITQHKEPEEKDIHLQHFSYFSIQFLCFFPMAVCNSKGIPWCWYCQ